MRITANQTTTRTLTDLNTALAKQHPVTITAWKEEKDATGRKTGRMVQTVRTIEIYEIATTKAGNVAINAMDRETGESRTFRVDRLISYTTHRTTYTVPVPADQETTAPTATLRTVAAYTAYEIARDERPRTLAPAA
jgi:hypothetical protein